MNNYRSALYLYLLVFVVPPVVQAKETIVGLCPDGSAFIVRRTEDIPCSRAKLVEPSEMPPMRPELLPRPFPWLVDQQARNPNNPYNLIEAAEAVRDMHSDEVRTSPERTQATPEPPPPTGLAASNGPALPPDELEALVELVELRQDIAPALIRAEDAIGRGRMEVRFAYSHSLEGVMLEWLGRDRSQSRVAIFAARALEAGEFYPSFFFLQDAEGFRPDPATPSEVGFLLGAGGPLELGAIRLGYVVLPARFQPERPIECWWNDRRVEATLDPGA
jgi:hypothetical protein